MGPSAYSNLERSYNEVRLNRSRFTKIEKLCPLFSELSCRKRNNNKQWVLGSNFDLANTGLKRANM